MAGKEDIHIGPVTGFEVRPEGRITEAEIHCAEGYTTRETKEAIAENHGLDPDTFEVRRKVIGGEAGRKSVSFSGNWGGSNWEPTGPVPNYGYDPNMN